jgi:hypothetical protein
MSDYSSDFQENNESSENTNRKEVNENELR